MLKITQLKFYVLISLLNVRYSNIYSMRYGVSPNTDRNYFYQLKKITIK